MKFKNVFSILGSAVLLSVVSFSCTNIDTTEDSTSTTATTTTAPMETTAASANLDTAKMPAEAMKTETMQVDNNTGMAKPNPAKKGMKGKVAVVETAMVKPTGKMEADNAGVYSNVEVIPSFPGGYKGLQKYFDDNLQYPEEASNDGVEGTVNLTFVVDENGKLTSPKAMGDKLGYGLEAEALRVVNKMPAWNPGKLKGKNVKTSFTLPVKFVLF